MLPFFEPFSVAEASLAVIPPSRYTYAYFMSLHVFASQFLAIRSTLT